MITQYEQNIIQAFKDLCEINKGASPSEVTNLLSDRDQLSKMDTVIDIADIMKELRNKGIL